MKSKGFVVIWFDGNRPAAFREFMKRGTVSEAAFFHQMNNITSSNVVSVIKPFVISTFDDKGEFRDKGEIVKEILATI